MSYLVPQTGNLWDAPALPSILGDDWIKRVGGVTISEDDSRVIVEAPVPGISPDKLDVTYHKGMLQIRTKEEAKEEEGTVRSMRALSYSIALPSDVDEEATPEARSENGLLKVVFPKAQVAQPKQIQVKKG